ncbi:MAG: hypothetical protein HQ490_00215 [Lutibacter sp.]|nr:hypothetical protein [Lutibacter sp.]
MKKFIFAVIFLFTIQLSGQAYQFPEVKGSKRARKINVYNGDKILKKCNAVTLSYRFAQGDKVDVLLKQKKKQKIKSFRVFLYPDFEKYSVADFKNDIDYSFIVPSTGVYKFVIVGGNCFCSKRYVNIKIDRQAISDSLENFNTDVSFREVTDTIVSFESQQFIIKSDTSIVEILDTEIKVSSQNAINGNKNRAATTIDLPRDVAMWSYYIGVGQPASKGYDDAIHKNLNTTATTLAATNPWYSLMVLGIDKFVRINAGENVKYKISTFPTASEQFLRTGYYPMDNFSLLKQNDAITDASKMSKPLQGKVHFLFSNDNMVFPIQLRLVVNCLVVHHEYETRQVRKVDYRKRLVPID